MLGPSGVGRPRVVGRREGEGGPGSRTRARIEGRGENTARWTQSNWPEPLCALEPADPDGQAGRRGMSRSASVASRQRNV